MQVNKNGIPVTVKTKKRKPLELELDKVTFYQYVEGQMVTIVVPYFSPLRKTLKSDGWRILK